MASGTAEGRHFALYFCPKEHYVCKVLLLWCALLTNLIFQIPAFASKGSGTVSSFGFQGEGPLQTFSFGLSSITPNGPTCNKSKMYAIHTNDIGAVFITSLIINLHKGSTSDWKGTPFLSVEGTGVCTYNFQAEDVKIIILKDADVNEFFFPYDSPHFKPNPAVYSKYALPPVIRDMSPRNHSQHLARVVQEFEGSLCGLGFTKSIEKFGTARAQLPNANLLKNNPLIGTMLQGMQSASCSLLKPSFDEMSKRTYREQIVGKAATAMWRTKDGAFHGVALFFENNEWKVDINFNSV